MESKVAAQIKDSFEGLEYLGGGGGGGGASGAIFPAGT